MFKNRFILKTQSIVYKCQGIVLSKDMVYAFQRI